MISQAFPEIGKQMADHGVSSASEIIDNPKRLHIKTLFEERSKENVVAQHGVIEHRSLNRSVLSEHEPNERNESASFKSHVVENLVGEIGVEGVHSLESSNDHADSATGACSSQESSNIQGAATRVEGACSWQQPSFGHALNVIGGACSSEDPSSNDSEQRLSSSISGWSEWLGINAITEEMHSPDEVADSHCERRLQIRTQELEDEGKTACSLCCELLSPLDARGSSCGHFFCLSCLRRYASCWKPDKEQVVCPAFSCSAILSPNMLKRLNPESPCRFDETSSQADSEPQPQLEPEPEACSQVEERRVDPVLDGQRDTPQEMITQQAVVAIVVDGAGGVGSSTNGEYAAFCTYEGKPMFKKIDGDAIIYFDENWKINFQGDVAGWYYQAPSGSLGWYGDEDLPPACTWTLDGYEHADADPPPAISWKLEALSGEQQTKCGDISECVSATDVQAQMFQCPICLEEHRQCDSVQLECGHLLCQDCLVKYLEAKITDAQVADKDLVCPMMNCGTGIGVPCIQDALHGTALWEKFLQFRLNQWQPEDDDIMFECPARGCEGRFLVAPDVPSVQCPSCHKEFCMKCKNLRHDGIECDSLGDVMRLSTDSDATFESFLNAYQLKRCPVCGVASERESGCNFMTCESLKCRRGRSCTFWCYVCAQELREDEHYSHFPDGPYEDVCYGRLSEAASSQPPPPPPLARKRGRGRGNDPARPERARAFEPQFLPEELAANAPLRAPRLAQRRRLPDPERLPGKDIRLGQRLLHRCRLHGGLCQEGAACLGRLM